MRTGLIVAMDDERGIGRAGALAWHNPSDLAHFRAMTMGCAVAFGRITWESIRRPLPGRTVVVITSGAADGLPEGVVAARDWDGAREAARAAGRDMLWAAGGTRVYAAAIAAGLDEASVTRIPGTHGCDAFAPEITGLHLVRIRIAPDADYETWVRERPEAI